MRHIGAPLSLSTSRETAVRVLVGAAFPGYSSYGSGQSSQ